ncbi:aminotransferase ['Osedax' symbiont bacterium Rs2_46_30_T18]|nr:aminotransferase ['Osedax' symbiont bacterium Rs2_46_30_T18]
MSARYIELSDEIIEQISTGKLAQGQRMPSIRKMTRQHSVSITTALNCYHRLQEQGWLHSVPQSGFFVSQPLDKSGVPIFPKFKAQVSKPRAAALVPPSQRGPLFSAQLSPALIPMAILNRALVRGNLKSGDTLYQYPDPQGEMSLRNALASHFSQQYFPLESDNLVITNGCMDAVRTALEITTRLGDAVAVSSPCFNGLLSLLENMGRLVVEIPCDQGGLDLLQLEQHMADQSVTACLLSANFINPQGICLSVQQKKKIAELATQYSIAVIEDDVFLELSYNQVAPLPIKNWDSDGWVIWCGSVSKTLAAGYRLGWCDPGRYFQRYLAHRDALSISVNQLAQNAVSEFVTSGQYIKHLRRLRLALAARAYSYHQLLRENLPAAARISAAEGGLVIWVQITGLDSELLLDKCKNQGIHFRIGSEFSSLNLYADCFRLNIGWAVCDERGSDGWQKLRQQLIDLCALVKETTG